MMVVVLRDVVQARSGRPDETPDRILGGEGPCGTHLPDANLVSFRPDLEQRVRVDSEPPPDLDRDGDLALLCDPVYLHVRKYYLP